MRLAARRPGETSCSELCIERHVHKVRGVHAICFFFLDCKADQPGSACFVHNFELFVIILLIIITGLLNKSLAL